MKGINCPRCGQVTTFGATTNAYPYVCKACDERFSADGAPMSSDPRYTSEVDYNCSCGWSERETRLIVDGENLSIPSPWQRYRIHLFLEHNVPLPSRIKFDLNGVMIDGD